MLTPESRMKLLDRIAALVDENYAGRSEMCQQFADLLLRALTYTQFPSRGVMGTAIYYDAKGKELFRWNHAWVRVGEEVIDGNVDSPGENPLVPNQLRVTPYWGPITPSFQRASKAWHRSRALPKDRRITTLGWSGPGPHPNNPPIGQIRRCDHQGKRYDQREPTDAWTHSRA